MTVQSIQRYKTPPFEHQRIGTAALVKNPAFALFDEMGAGKSKQVIDAACILAEQGKIDTVVIVAPASVRCVWLDKEIGEIRKHSWQSNRVSEFHQKIKMVWEDKYSTPHINWVVTNYEFLRGEKHIAALCGLLEGRKALLVLDESSYVKSRTAKQTKAVKELRQHCARVVALNGTPITNSPLDLWAQMEILDPKILRFDNFYAFRAQYAELVQRKMGMMRFKEVKGYKNLDELAQRVAPYVLRREKKDCLDLPPKLYTEREVALTPESWKRYQELKRDALLTLGDGNVQMEPNAVVRIMRLAQLTSGILGATFEPETRDLSDEKLRWAVQYLTEECPKTVIVWCRWRKERERLASELRLSVAAGCSVGLVCELYGSQKKQDRDEAVWNFSQQVDQEKKRGVLIAQPHAGGFGLNLVAASEAIYLSNDFSLGIRLQSEDRMHRPGQSNKCLYIDVLATGPNGERTVDHVIAKALREKKHLALLTCAEWRKELE
jgi:SNF2 family DNA or RNA helicase